MPSIKTRISRIQQSMLQAEQRYGRIIGSTQLMAVSKTQPVECILEAEECGIQHLGESYANEALQKIDELRDRPIIWHFIGPIQSNKTRIIAENFAWAHSVDRLKIAQRLSAHRAGSSHSLKVCLQVNISEEASKSGVTINALPTLADQVATLPGLSLRGLMAIPRRAEEIGEQRRQFALVRELLENLILQGHALDTLCMGMSDDFEAAIAEGATMVRIGAGIFGPRKNTNSG